MGQDGLQYSLDDSCLIVGLAVILGQLGLLASNC